MRYLVLLIGDGAEKPWPEQTEAEQAAAMAKFGEFDAACRAREGVELLAGEALAGPRDATVMRTAAGRVELKGVALPVPIRRAAELVATPDLSPADPQMPTTLAT